MKKVLIVHGWLHSVDMYNKLKADIERYCNFQVILFELPGFGGTPAHKYFNLLEYYASEVEKELGRESYDYAIGHSMGGNVLLRAMSHKRYSTKLILLSPEYGGIDLLKPLTIVSPVALLFLLICRAFPCRMTTLIIKGVALFTINDWEKINYQIIKDARRANSLVAVSSMIELSWDRWRIKYGQLSGEKVNLILCGRDRIISRRKMRLLCSDLRNCRVQCIKKSGHTAVLEEYDRLFYLLMKIMECVWECRWCNELSYYE